MQSAINRRSDYANDKFTIKNITFYIGVFLIITSDSSFVMTKATSGTTRIIVDLVAMALILISCRIRSSVNDMFKIIGLLSVPLLSMALTGNIKQTGIFVICIAIAWVVVAAVDENDFIVTFNQIMTFLSWYSLVIMVTYLVLPAVIESFPTTVITKSYISYNAFFSVIVENWYVMRNYGMFWEPGAFSVFLCIALYFELFYFKPKYSRVILYVITIATTFSTLGVVCMLVLLIGVFAKGNRRTKSRIKGLVVFILIIGAVYIAVDGEHFLNQVFGKIINPNDSAKTRYNAIIYPFEAFTSSPIFGIGLNEFLKLLESKCNGMATFTYLNCAAIYGILWGLIPMYGGMRFFSKNVNGIIDKVIIILFSIVLFSTEAFEQITVFYVWVLYGMRNATAGKGVPQ